MSRRFGVYLIALALGASPLLAAEPWDFPGGSQEAATARKKFPSPYFQIYPGVAKALEDKKIDLNEAITKLRVCIKEQPRSNPRAEDRQANKLFPYFPYFMLAKAFAQQGKYDLAKRCVDKEVADGVIAGSSLAAEAQQMKTDLANLGALPLMKSWADTVLGWGSGSGSPSLMSGRGGAVGEIKSLRSQLDNTTPAAAKGVIDQIRPKLIGLCAEEIKARRDLLDELRSDAWKEALAAGGGAPPAGACTVPASGKEPGDAIEAVERCDQALTDALRKAGRGECDSLADLKASVDAAAGEVKASKDAGGLPAACGATRWAEATVADLRQGFESLRKDRAATRQRLAKSLGEHQQQLGTQLAEIREKVKQAQAKLPADLPAACMQDLRFADASGDIARLRKSLDPDLVKAGRIPPDLLRADALVNDALEALTRQVRSGVDAMLREKGECPGVATANLDALGPLRDAYASRKQPSELRDLCTKARAASSDLNACWDKNVTIVQQKVKDFLGLASAATAVRSEATPACLQGALEGLRRRERAPTGAGVAEWAKGAREAIGTTQACLTESHAGIERQWKEVAGRVTASLGPLAGGTGPASSDTLSPELKQIARSVEKVANDLKKAGDRFKALEPLFAAEPGADASVDARAALTKAGLAEGIGPGIWPVLEAARGRNDTALATEAIKVARDAVAGPELKRAASALESFGPIAERLAPFWALNASFSAFAAGDLDGAIRGLRDELGHGSLPASGRGAAMVHAALSYFLATKAAMARATGGAAAAMLEQDAREQAKKACGAEPRFRPPDALLDNDTFSQVFQRACT